MSSMFSFLTLLVSLISIHIITTQWRLYDTNEVYEKSYHDCLYLFLSEHSPETEAPRELIPYCIRLHNKNASISHREQFNRTRTDIRKTYTFIELREQNRTTKDLYQWQAPIDTIEAYDIYLEYNDESLSANLFHHCQSSCFGKIDCSEGTDEENCFQLEINECDLINEFRCRNGLCIPNEFFNDEDSDCLDGSDETGSVYHPECQFDFLNPSIICEERSCGLYEFSCADSNCLKHFPIQANRTLGDCLSGRDIKFRTNQFNRISDNYTEQCWESIIEKIGFSDSFYIDDNKLDYSDTRISNECPPMILFPSAPVIYGHIRFIYFSNRTNWFMNVAPDLICFNSIWCPSFEISAIIDNFTCIHFTRLSFDERYQNWNDMILAIANLFRECSHPQMQIKDRACLHSSLIPCGNSSKCLSKYRLKDKYNDCSNSLDEFSTKTCHLNLTHRFKCTSEDECIPLLMVADRHADCLDKSDESIRLENCPKSGKDLCHVQNLPEKVLFQEICNGIQNIFPSNMENETDETNCEQWPCVTYYTGCNYVWNCKDGRDELKCYDIHQCPDEKDDENLLCTWNDQCQSNQYRCKDGTKAQRCDVEIQCNSKEDELLCDLSDIPSREMFFGIANSDYNRYPSMIIEYPSNPTKFIQYKRKTTSMNDLPEEYLGWYCHRGILIRTIHSYFCLCSPAYYGNRCQYESDRITVILQLHSPPLVVRNQIFKFLIFLLDRDENIISYEEIIYSDMNFCLAKYLLYLLYPTQPKLKTNYSVRIDQFILTREQGIRYGQSWFFNNIPFHFLPINRITSLLKFSIKSASIVRCGQVHCIHGRCVQYVNIPQIFCHCDDGWLGKLCNIRANCQCSQRSLCISNNSCLCPIGRIGPLCRVPYNPCHSNTCRNNGTCIPVDSRAITDYYYETQQQYVCICLDEFAGRYCEIISARIHIQLPSLSISSVLIHFIKTAERFLFTPRRRSLYRRIPSNLDSNLTIYTTFIDPPDYLPNLIYIQTFDKNILSQYYLVGIIPIEQNIKELNTSVQSSHRCPHINELFNSTILHLNPLQRIKFYQYPCLEKEIHCFYDENQMCLCNKFHHVDCFEFNQSLLLCDQSICENNGICIRDEDTCNPKSLCICQTCFYGIYCQFTTQKYVLSLDGILGQYILQEIQLKNQPFLIQITLIIIIQTARIRSNVRKQISYRNHLKIQFQEYKHLIISPCILILLALPRLIISLVYACMKDERQPYLFLFGYSISFTPYLAIFIIFILPSETYRKDFCRAWKLLF
ncbi:hypothetical protein I4U23_004409 [Adineta vaga]|nr:hypothetical protein I4U23_004409 [Adineta vaga]